MNINLGCGRHPLENYINVDVNCLGGKKPDIIWDLENGLEIFPDNYADIIWANMVLEHICNYENIIREIYRVLKHCGKLCLNVPDSNGTNAWGHPQHVRGFNMTSFRYWVKGTDEYTAFQPGIEFSIEKYETNGEVISAILVAVKDL